MDQTGRPSQDLLRLLAAARGEGHRPQQATNRPDGRLHRPICLQVGESNST